MASEIPTTQKALVEDESGSSASIRDHPVPQLGKNDVLVKVAYVSQNPTDWKHAAFPPISVKGSVIGCDYAGTVVKIGEDVVNDLQIGDKVASFVHGGKFADKGAFAQYLKVQSDLVWKVPDQDSVGLKEAPQYGIAFSTAAQVLYHSQGTSFPPSKVAGDQWYLVYGGSSSVGLFSIQLAKLAGYTVVAVASSKNHDLLTSYGADEVVDYKDAEKAISEIKRITGDSLAIGLDTISEDSSIPIALKAFSSKTDKKTLNLLLPPSDKIKELAKETQVELGHTLAYTLLGGSFDMTATTHIPASDSDREFYVKLNKATPELIARYGIKPNPVKEFGDLNSIPDGFEYMKSGKVSGEKLTYKID